jgi:hypothetical protein
MTTEQTIVDALVARLATVKAGGTVTVNGTQYTYTSTIRTATDGRVAPFSESDLPAANVFTPESSAETISPAHHDHTLSAVIVLHVADRTAQKTVRALRQDVYAALASDESLGGVAGLISIGDPARVTKCIQMADFIGSEQITIPIIYRTARWGV